MVWKRAIPSHFTFHEKTITEKDACTSMPDGKKVLAKGLALYLFLKNNQLEHRSQTSKNNSVAQTGSVYYFECKDQRIHKLKQCPSGQLFIEDKCEFINLCYGKSDGILFPHNEDHNSYFECIQGQNVLKKCPADEIFVVNHCYDKKDDYIFCSHFHGSFLIDEVTRLDCLHRKPVYTTCPPNYKFFDESHCELAVCEKQPDGTRLSMDIEIRDPFSFVPGYYICQNDRVDEEITCSDHWDKNESNLTQLPMVFDNGQCSVPELCKNVQLMDPNKIVPEHIFTKQAQNWELAALYDSLVGYRCEQKTMKKVDLQDGHIIENYEITSGCTAGVTLLPVYGSPDKYYDCHLASVGKCSDGEEFDGKMCKPILKHAFKLDRISLFRFDNLSFDNWIKPWNYSPHKTPLDCSGEDQVLIVNFNVCSHKDCAIYSFLPQIPDFSIQTKDGFFTCTFDSAQKSIVKEPKPATSEGLSYWFQRNTYIPNWNCNVGQKISTGNYIWDQSIYATCDDKQPFVFCPSSEVEGIVQVENRYACETPHYNQYVILESNTEYVFEEHELSQMLPTVPNQEVNLPSGKIILPPEGLDLTNMKVTKLKTDNPLHVQYAYRVTHPPDVIYENGLYKKSKWKSDESAFLVKKKDFTKKPIAYPIYNIETFMEGVNKGWTVKN